MRKELIVFALAYNLVRMQMVDAAIRQQVDPQRVSFIDALRLMQWHAGVPARESDDDTLDPPPRGRSIALIINPHRSGRHQPRAIKRRPPQQRLLTEPRGKARKRLYSG